MSYYIILTKNVLGDILGDFFHKLIRSPGRGLTRKKEAIVCKHARTADGKAIKNFTAYNFLVRFENQN
jgi:hypothetical protein